MKMLLASTGFLVITAVACVLVGLVLAFQLKDFTWLARFGALIVGLGIICLSRTFILGKDLLMNIGSGESDNLNLNGPEHYQVRGEKVPDYVVNDQKGRFALGVAGPTMSFAGTLIWGFADLLNKLFAGFGLAVA